MEIGNQNQILLRISSIIPTKDRPTDLVAAVRSLLVQTVRSFTLLIVDQSRTDEARHLIEGEVEIANLRPQGFALHYIRDPGIAGAAAARNYAMRLADGDVWLFLDDDVVLEPDFLHQLLAAYRDYPRALGVSGIITNYRSASLPYRIWSAMFVRGPFHDERQKIYWNAEKLRKSPPIRVRRFTGALMSFRASAARDLSFDENLDSFQGISDGEDIAFCEKLGPGVELRIAPRARLQHNRSPLGRLTDHWLRRHARANCFLYERFYRDQRFSNRLDYLLLWVGYALVAGASSIRRRSLEPWRALVTAMNEVRRALMPRSPSAVANSNSRL